MLRAEPLADLLHHRQLARLVVLPQPAEAAQLALQVAGRLAVALEAARAPVHVVDLDQRVHQLLGGAAALVGCVERGRDLRWRARSRASPPSRRRARPGSPRRRPPPAPVGTRTGVPSSALSRRASRSTSWAEGGSGGRGGRRSTTRASPRRTRKVMFEWPSPIRSASRRPCADAVRVEELLERLAHERAAAAPARRRPALCRPRPSRPGSYVVAQASTRNQPWRPLPSRTSSTRMWAGTSRPSGGTSRASNSRRGSLAGQHLHQVRGHVAAIRRVQEPAPAEAAQRGLVQSHERAEGAVRAPHGAVHADHGAGPEIVQRDFHQLTGSTSARGSPITRAARPRGPPSSDRPPPVAGRPGWWRDSESV